MPADHATAPVPAPAAAEPVHRPGTDATTATSCTWRAAEPTTSAAKCSRSAHPARAAALRASPGRPCWAEYAFGIHGPSAGREWLQSPVRRPAWSDRRPGIWCRPDRWTTDRRRWMETGVRLACEPPECREFPQYWPEDVTWIQRELVLWH